MFEHVFARVFHLVSNVIHGERLGFCVEEIVQVGLVDWPSRGIGVVYVIVVILDFNVSVLNVIDEAHHLFILDSTGPIDALVPEPVQLGELFRLGRDSCFSFRG